MPTVTLETARKVLKRAEDLFSDYLSTLGDRKVTGKENNPNAWTLQYELIPPFDINPNKWRWIYLEVSKRSTEIIRQINTEENLIGDEMLRGGTYGNPVSYTEGSILMDDLSIGKVSSSTKLYPINVHFHLAHDIRIK